MPDLGLVEAHLQAAIKRAVGSKVLVKNGPAVEGPATGLCAEVFVHAVRFEDGGAVTPDGSRTARRAVRAAGGLRGYEEERQARIVVEVTCVCASLRQAQQLAALVVPPLLVALEALGEPMLAASPNGAVSLRLADTCSLLHACDTSAQPNCHHARLTFHIDGFAHLRVTKRGGLVARK